MCTTNQSLEALPIELELALDWIEICLRPPVGGMTEFCTGIIICWPGTILSSGGVVTVSDGFEILDVAINVGITDTTSALFGMEYNGTPSEDITEELLAFCGSVVFSNTDAWSVTALLTCD